MRVDPARLVVVADPAARPADFASTGSLLLPGGHGYVIVPAAFAVSDIADEPVSALLLGYALAHEVAHLQLEHYLVRWAATAAAGLLALGVAPLVSLRRGWRPKAAATLAMWAVVPGFFATRALARAQERAADAAAAAAAPQYAHGGLQFWRRLAAARAAPAPPAYTALWRTHPPPAERLQFFEQAV